MLLNAPYPADIRVKKEADALVSAGYEILLLCLRKKSEAYKEVIEGISITRIDAGKNNPGLAFWDILMSMFFVHPKFYGAMKKIVKSERPIAIHVHDLPLAGSALVVRKIFPAIRVVIDFHENYPEALRTWFRWKKNPIVRLKNYLFMNPARWTKLERRACEQSDVIIAVVEEMKARLISEYDILDSKITVVTNTEDKSFVNQVLDKDVYSNFDNKFILVYCGGIGPHRGVDTAIEAMGLLRNEKEIHLVIVGFGSASVMNKLKSQVANLKLDNVHFLGYQPFSKFYSFMKMAHVNIIPHQANGHTNNTVPHKLFQGMMSGQPLLVSSCAPLKRLVEKFQSGMIFKAGDAKDFAMQVRKLHSNKSLQEQLGANGRKATLEGNLNWDYSKNDLLNLYHKIIQ